ncbi:Multidrug resistance protein MdtA precursor [Anatilimnocola aggregata]|uniref:Multidrug resistance protein MdtA n=1 Tax=Anatilimnocola aggregata TaxID=2528021 RepID=A0A517Y628_9BACT|nr:efflux RND transporter periplasmic adaptor subunit [Anatilimnocola aggregata]QDU25685.1 Multidrug resistance protein MdtA precursor [Anatilimnocola aggregata]
MSVSRRSSVFITAAAAVALAIPLVGCGSHGAKPEPTAVAAPPKPVIVTVAALETRSVQRRITAVGTLHGLERIQISAKVPGRIEKVLVDVGDRIKPGAVLVELDPTDFKLALDEAQRSLEKELSKLGLTEMPKGQFDAEQLPSMIRGRLLVDNARRRYERFRNLFQKNAGTNEEFEKAETDLRVEESTLLQTQLDIRATMAAVRYSQSVLETAQRQLAETRITAPPSDFPSVKELQQQGVGYVVAKRMATAGELATAGSSPLLELVIDDALKLRATVPERYASELQLGQAVEVRVEAYPNDVFQARIARISPTIDSESRTFEIEAYVPNNDHRLQHGCFAKGAIVTRTADQAIMAPAESVITYAGVTKIFCQDGDTVRDVPVALGVRDAGWVEVIGDLPAQAVAVTSGQTQLANGSRISVRQPLAVAAPQVMPASHLVDMEQLAPEVNSKNAVDQARNSQNSAGTR